MAAPTKKRSFSSIEEKSSEGYQRKFTKTFICHTFPTAPRKILPVSPPYTDPESESNDPDSESDDGQNSKAYVPDSEHDDDQESLADDNQELQSDDDLDSLADDYQESEHEIRDFRLANPLVNIRYCDDITGLPTGYSLSGKVVGDGNCLPRAILMALNGAQNLHSDLRQRAVSYIRENPAHFKCDIEMVDQCSVEEYCANMSKGGVFGDVIFLMACCIIEHVTIQLFTMNSHCSANGELRNWTVQSFEPVETVHSIQIYLDSGDSEQIWEGGKTTGNNTKRLPHYDTFSISTPHSSKRAGMIFSSLFSYYLLDVIDDSPEQIFDTTLFSNDKSESEKDEGLGDQVLDNPTRYTLAPQKRVKHKEQYVVDLPYEVVMEAEKHTESLVEYDVDANGIIQKLFFEITPQHVMESSFKDIFKKKRDTNIKKARKGRNISIAALQLEGPPCVGISLVHGEKKYRLACFYGNRKNVVNCSNTSKRGKITLRNICQCCCLYYKFFNNALKATYDPKVAWNMPASSSGNESH